VDIADSGFKCLELVAKNTYDAIFIDNLMPELSGKETIKRLRAAGYKLPIISLSGTSGIEEQKAIMDAGADYMLLKPSSKDVIDKTLRMLAKNVIDK
jgi:DNA-binding response OmpR family regulator